MRLVMLWHDEAMEVWFNNLPEYTQWVFVILLFCSFFVCFVALLSIGQSSSVGWFSGPTGHPIFFFLMCLGVILPPLILFYLFAHIAVYLLATIGVLIFVNYLLSWRNRDKPLSDFVSFGGDTDRAVFIGNSKKLIYHTTSCEYQLKIYPPSSRIRFYSEEEARNKGYRPCQVCISPSPDNTNTSK